MVQLNDKKFIWFIIGSFLICSGNLLKDGYKSLQLPAISIGYKLGPVLNALGWIVLALSISTTVKSSSLFDVMMNQHGALSIFAIALIYWSSFEMDKYQTCDTSLDSECPSYIVAAYSGGWMLLALALAIQAKFGWLNTFLASIGSLSIIASKVGVLPLQRLISMVDGTGYSLEMAGWVAILLSNSVL